MGFYKFLYVENGSFPLGVLACSVKKHDKEYKKIFGIVSFILEDAHVRHMIGQNGVSVMRKEKTFSR